MHVLSDFWFAETLCLTFSLACVMSTEATVRCTETTRLRVSDRTRGLSDVDYGA